MISQVAVIFVIYNLLKLLEGGGMAPKKEKKNRVADIVFFDPDKKLYTIVGEIKKDEEGKMRMGVFQNLEQMLGLWQKDQKVMLGFTAWHNCMKFQIMFRENDFMKVRVTDDIQYVHIDDICQAFMLFLFCIDCWM